TTGNGTWQYSTDGSTWTNFGAVSRTNALLITSTTQVRYVPNGISGETATFSYKAWDQTSGTASTNATPGYASTASSGGTTAFSSNNALAQIVVSNANDAPTITNLYTHTLTGTNEDTTSSGTLASALLTGASWGDVDTGAVSGLAITSTTGGGTWQYSTDGVTWTSFGAVSSTNALLIASTSQVRYIPNGQNGETGTFSYKAWDQTSGSASTNATPSYASTATSGGTTAFSSENATAQITVTNVNDAPVLNASASPTVGTVLEGATNPSGVTVASLVVDASITDQDGTAIEAIAITGLNTSLGVWQYSLNGGTSWLTINSELINSSTNELALLLGSTAQLRLIPFGDLSGSVSDGITFRAWDQTSGSEGEYTVVTNTGGTSAFSSGSDIASVAVVAVNDSPTFLSGDGIVSTAIGTGNDLGYSVTLQPDGKFLVAGFSAGSTNDFAIARYNADGSLDAGFGNGGKVTTPIGTSTDQAGSITLQADGKIVVGGYAMIGTNNDFALVRYNADGTLDTSFGSSGIVTTAIGTSS
ncbi:MAG: hypothetical protein ACK5PZ_20040, partial [Pirellula sp.]